MLHELRCFIMESPRSFWFHIHPTVQSMNVLLAIITQPEVENILLNPPKLLVVTINWGLSFNDYWPQWMDFDASLWSLPKLLLQNNWWSPRDGSRLFDSCLVYTSEATWVASSVFCFILHIVSGGYQFFEAFKETCMHGGWTLNLHALQGTEATSCQRALTLLQSLRWLATISFYVCCFLRLHVCVKCMLLCKHLHVFCQDASALVRGDRQAKWLSLPSLDV